MNNKQKDPGCWNIFGCQEWAADAAKTKGIRLAVNNQPYSFIF